MESIWVVTGTYGEYSDRTEWVERAFASESEAQKFCDEISAAAREYRIQHDAWYKRVLAVHRQSLGDVWFHQLTPEQKLVWDAVTQSAGSEPTFSGTLGTEMPAGEEYGVEQVAVGWPARVPA